LGLAESVVFAGPAFGNKKAELMRRASVFVLPSFSEGLPMAVLEAWSYGLPVLMTDECHLREGFDANAAVRATPHPASLTAGLTKLLIDMDAAARSDMGERGRALVQRKFTWPRIGEDMVAVYQGLCSARLAARSARVR
jgi:poly(glycerol-phosphate) alpha-glucosyltransferase